LVGNFTVDTNGSDHAGIRWFELQKTGAADWDLHQEGTHSPDTDHRWMGSIAMDGSGNIALGYSVSSLTTYPSLRYASRLRGDTLGTLQAEATLYPGGGSQTGPYDRWGDYSSMSIDPADECTFWYTGEYHDTTADSFSWNTRIGKFRLPECTGSLGPDFTISATPAELAVCAPTSAVFDVNVNYMSGFNSTVNLSAASLPAGATANFVPTSVVTPTTQSILTIGTAGATAGSYDVEIIGTSVPTPTHSTIVGLDLFTASPAAPTLVAPTDGLTDVPLVPTFSWNGTAQAAEYYLQVATDSGFSNVVYSATVAGTSHTMTGMNLEAEETYYWRVRATNECGDSAYSTAYSFTTVLLFCSYPNAAITDNNTTLDTLTSSRNQPISDLNVYVQLTHTYIGDLDITLTNQATGSSVVLLPTSFTCSGDNIDATFDDEAGSAIVCGTSVPALSGDVRPSGSLGTFDYDALAGTWQIAVHDGVGGDVGTLAEWCLQPQFASGVGAVAGTVTDANTTDPLAGVTLTVTDGSNSYNALTNAAGEYSRAVANGTYTVTAVLANYTTAQATGIAVTDGVTTTQDFALNAGIVTSSADDFAATLELATSTTLPWNLSNTGTAALDYDIRIIDGGYNPGRALQAGEDILVVASDTTAATAMETALTTLGFTYLRVTPTVFQSLTVPDLLAYKAVFHTGNTADASETLIMAYLDAGGVFYVSDNDLGYFNGTTVFYQTYLQATYVGDDPSINIIIGEDFMAGLSADISADPYPDHFTVRPEGTRILSFQGGNAAGVAVNRLGYKAVYTSFDYDDIASAADELAFMDAITGFLINTGDYWLSTDIEEGTLAVGADQDIVVTMDANNVALAGTYYADLVVQNNTPYEDIVIPVTMTVTCPTCGTLDGEITDDFTGDPLVASVQITSTGGFDYTIDGSAYSIALPPGAYYLSVTAPDYLPETAVATVTQGATTTTDFALTPAFAALVYDPAAIEETMEIGDVVTNTVTVTNTGTIDLDFDVNIGGFGGPGLLSVQKVESSTAVNIPADDGKFERGTAAPSIEKAPVNAAGSSAATKSLNQLLGTISYATDAGLTQFISVDLATPGSPTNIAAFTNSIWAGDIANGLVYAIDDVTTNLITIDTATGAPTVVGSTGNANTTGMAYDPVTGNMYVSDVTTCGTSSRLHTINLSTGALTLIGTVTNSPCLIGIAANSAGQLYGYDIVNDTLLSIDKATGASTVVGSLGFDANYGQGMGFDAASGQMYLAAFNNVTFQAELRIADLATGNTTLVGAFGTSGTSQYGWLAIPGLGSGGSGNWATTPFEGATVAPGETATFEVVFDATSLYQIGDYTADLSFSGNFINDVPDMPLTMHLSCPTCGILDGSITDGDTGDPLVADVHVTGPNGFDVTVSGDSYQLAVADGDYDFTVSANGYFSQTATVEATTGVTVTTDFALRLAQPNISVDPESFDVTVALGDTATHPLDIINDGALGTAFELREQPVVGRIVLGDLIQDGSFEADPTTGPWTEVDTTACTPWIGDWTSIFGFSAYDGLQTFWAGGACGAANSNSAEQTITIPAGHGEMSFWYYAMRSDADDPTDNGEAYVQINGTTVWSLEMNLANNTSDWTYQTVDISAYAGQTVALKFGATQGASGVGNVLFDYVETTLTGSTDVPWLSTNPITGTVAADSTETVDVIFDTTVLTQTGVYNAVLKVLTGDPTNPTINIPVTLTVIDSEYLVYLPVIAKP
jgi:subtilisin-like proprotein convertase family protein